MALAAIAAGVYLWQRNPRSRRSARQHGRAGPGEERAASTYVGEPACTPCHEAQTKEWRQSHHARAMEVASDATMLGDFNNASFTYAGITSTFSKRDGKFFVRTDGPDGQLHDYEIAYTFGFTPLQQYLVAFPGGRYQCLPIAWDTPPEGEGRPAVVPPLPGGAHHLGRPAPLDGAEPELELHVRGLPLDEPGPQLRSRHQQLQDDLVRDQRVV